MRSVVHLPKKDSSMNFYLPAPRTDSVPDRYTNADLPNMRATYLKQVIDEFLKSCRIEKNFSQQSVVLEGAVVDASNPAYRTVEVFFYATK
jgi:hypothetical protein